MIINLKKWACLIGISLLIAGCGAGSTQEEGESVVAMQYDMTGFLAQNLNQPTSRALTNTPDQILRGQMSATAIGGANDGNVELFTWTIYLDEDTLAAQSNSTLTLVPGNYDFELLVTKGNQQYAGYVNQTVIDGTNDIAMTIKPIIGDVVSDVTIIDRLAFFKFQYSLDDLAALLSPSIGIQVDSDAEQIFTINTQTGMSNAFVNLPVGVHTLLLKLYDSSIQVGKSITEQETQTVAYGTDLAMDIVPLHGEMQFILTEDGGDANLSISIPEEVVNEVGGVNNLTAALALVGVKNPLQESALLFIDQGNGSYQADVVLTDLQYEDVTLSLTFADTATSDQIASCNNVWSINNQSQSFVCDITLIRRAIIGSNILAVLGLNVENDLGQPVSGAVVKNANGDVLGVTGSGTYGSTGYVKLYLKAGDHEITATDLSAGQAKTTTVSLSPLEVENVSLVLEDIYQDAIGFTGDFAAANWTISGVAASSMSGTTLTANVGSGGGGVAAITTIPTDGIINFDWSMTVYSAGQYGDSISYAVNGVTTVLSSAGSNSGSEASIAVSAGDTFEFKTWGSTSSSSYNAVFSNFSFIVN